MTRINILLIALIVAACHPKEKKQTTASQEEQTKQAQHIVYSQYPDLLVKALKAHGGLDAWQGYGTLRFDKVSEEGNSETHTVNLYNRKILIDRDTAKIGFDGQEVWVSPDLAAFGKGSARFYHNLYFYFFGIPFLLSDPGIVYEDLGTVSIDGKTYRTLKASYKDGVGDSDDDVYIAHFDPETFQLALLLYTVTYYSGEQSDKFNALIYNNWQKVGGLLVPKSFAGYGYQNGSIGDKRYTTSFENVAFDKLEPPAELFDQPKNSEIDSLKRG